MPGQFLPADHSRGDANTLGGYVAVHDRPAAFQGSDGFSYSVEILTDGTGDPGQPVGAYLFFVQWARIGAAAPQGHLESEFLVRGRSEAEARERVGALPLAEVKRILDALIAARHAGTPPRAWRDATGGSGPDVGE